MNKKQFLKNRAEFNRLKKYVYKLLIELEKEVKYYKDEIKQNDYNDDDIWAIVKGSLNNTDLAILKLYFKYACKFNQHGRHHAKWFNYGDSFSTFNSSDELLWDFNLIMKFYMTDSCFLIDSIFDWKLDYDDYKKTYEDFKLSKRYEQFTRLIHALNEFKQSHQAELLNQEPIDVFNYGFCDETTSILLSSDSETDEDEEPDEPDEPDDIEESSDISEIYKSSISNFSISSL